jgi:hypothetical protein
MGNVDLIKLRGRKAGMGKRETAAFVCSHVFDATRPVLLISHQGGDWQFLCGESHDADEVPRVVGLNHLIERDATLRDVLDLPSDWDAERTTVSASWTRMPTPSDG